MAEVSPKCDDTTRVYKYEKGDCDLAESDSHTLIVEKLEA